MERSRSQPVREPRVSTVMPFVDWEASSPRVDLDEHTTLFLLEESPLIPLLKRLANDDLFEVHAWPGTGAVIDSPWFTNADPNVGMPGWDRNRLAMALLGISCGLGPIWTQIVHSAEGYRKLIAVQETPPDWECPQVVFIGGETGKQPVCNAETLGFLVRAWHRLFRSPEGPNYRNRVHRTISYYASAFMARSDEEAIVCLAIGLETLFAPHSHSEVSTQVATNVCRFLATKVAARKKLFREVKGLYRVRSAIVHGDIPSSFRRQMAANRAGYEILAHSLRRLFDADSEDLFAVFSEEESRRSYLEKLYFG